MVEGAASLLVNKHNRVLLHYNNDFADIDMIILTRVACCCKDLSTFEVYFVSRSADLTKYTNLLYMYVSESVCAGGDMAHIRGQQYPMSMEYVHA